MAQSQQAERDEALAARAEREQALAAYVELERAQVPLLHELFPGMYSDLRVEGELSYIDAQGLPAGTYAVVQFHYVYAEVRDWSIASPLLDTQRETFDRLCESEVFPDMRAAGITPPLRVLYFYHDERTGDFAPWAHYCNAQR
ncbi:hypothetical protein ACVWW9_002640 [Agrococcus sp. UYP33]